MSYLRKGLEWLSEEPHHQIGLRLLQVFIGLVVLFRVFTELPFRDYLWGPTGVAGQASTSGKLLSLVDLSNLAYSSPGGTLEQMALLTVGALGLVFAIQTRIATIVLSTSLLLQQCRLPLITDGGDNILQLVLIYMVFALPAGAKPARGSLSVWLHNVTVLAIIFQVVVLYATSGLSKVAGAKWEHGVAMYYISQVNWFSLPATRQVFSNPVIVTYATYIPMLYQVFFPVAILSRLKIPWLALGILFHLGTAVMLGLVTFCGIMIGLELFLITDQEYAHLEHGLKDLSRTQRWHHLWRRVQPPR